MTAKRARRKPLTALPPEKTRGATSLHRAQKAETRQTIIEAARAIFVENSYSATTVDAIRQRAGVSRSSFYRHFSDKWSLGKVIFGEFPLEISSQWNLLAAMKDPSLKDIAAWLRAFLKKLEEKIPFITLLGEIEAVEPESIAITVANINERLRLLAQADPAFSKIARETDSEERYFAELFFFQFDRFTYLVSARGWHSKDEAAIHAMARHVLTFLHSQRAPITRR